MSQQVYLEMGYRTYRELCEAVEKAAEYADGFEEMQDLVHLVDFLDDEYGRDRSKQDSDYKTWKLHEELFRNEEIYHQEYFYDVNDVFKDNEENGLLEWNISEQDRFHLICEIIDVFIKKESE
jgi:hypothetical protein